MEDDVEACYIDEDTTYAEESNNSKSADSDFEIEEDPDSAGGSTEDSAVQYNRPVTRRTVKKEEISTESEGMVTRSKVSKEAQENEKEEKGDSLADNTCSSNVENVFEMKNRSQSNANLNQNLSLFQSKGRMKVQKQTCLSFHLLYPYSHTIQQQVNLPILMWIQSQLL